MSTLSWQAGTASGPFLVGTLIQACVIVMYPSYEPTNWQGTLMVIAVTGLVWLLNIYGSNLMPIFQNVMLSPRASTTQTFTHFTNGGGWSSMGLALMVGQISAVYACICTSHLTPYPQISYP